MKKLFLLPLVLVVIAGLLAFWFYTNSKPVSNVANFKDFLITKGSGASQIGNKLEKEGLIKNALAFKIYVQVNGQAGRIQAGEYRLSPGLSLFGLVKELLTGPRELWVTVPEGLRREEIAQRFASSLGKDEEFIDSFLDASDGFEGHLFPDTYLFPKTASASAVVNKMTRTFDSKTSDLDLTRDQIILASLIERETRTDEERPVVAGILMNRLAIGMALQVDATVQYAKGSWGVVTKEDLEINSPYNTYKFPGLPPSPIANPGLSSLKAAASPEESDYFYYLHDSNGQIHYAKTLEEHNRNINTYLTR